MEKHKIVLNSKPIEYEITYKNMKNIRMKIDEGILKISAPYHTSITYIEELIFKNKDQLLASLDQYIPYYQYNHQGFVYIFHKRYTIIERDIEKKQCSLHDDKIYVYTHHIQTCLEAYLKEILMNYMLDHLIHLTHNDHIYIL